MPYHYDNSNRLSIILQQQIYPHVPINKVLRQITAVTDYPPLLWMYYHRWPTTHHHSNHIIIVPVIASFLKPLQLPINSLNSIFSIFFVLYPISNVNILHLCKSRGNVNFSDDNVIQGFGWLIERSFVSGHKVRMGWISIGVKGNYHLTLLILLPVLAPED